MEQFAGQSRVARERLVAMQAARLAGLAACASAARRSYGDAISLVERLAGEGRVFDAQFVALALIRQDLGGTDAGRRLMDELDRIASAESRDRALAALVPATPGAAEVLRASSDAAMAAGDMDDGDLGRIQAGNAVLGALKDTRRLDSSTRAWEQGSTLPLTHAPPSVARGRRMRRTSAAVGIFSPKIGCE
jgi:hypothetical protein